MLGLLVGAGGWWTASRAGAHGPPVLRYRGRILLRGVSGRLDHLAVDLDAQRLYVAAVSPGSVEVVDLRLGRRVASYPALPGAAAVVVDARHRQLAVSGEAAGRVDFLDQASLQPLASLRDMPAADTLRIDAQRGFLFVGQGEGAVLAVDVAAHRVVQTYPLAGHPESLELDPAGRWVYANVPDAGEVTVLDRRTGTVAAHWPLPGAGHNYPLALDADHQRLFVGCRWPAALVVLDTANGHRVATVPLALDVDDLWYDGATRRLYASCGAGRLDVIQADSPDRYHPLATFATRLGARTSVFVPAQRRVYLAVPRRFGHPAAVWVYDAVE